MGLEKQLEFQGLAIPRVYGTITRSTLRTEKNYVEDKFYCQYQLNWYVIQQYNGQDCITTPIQTEVKSFEVSDLNANLYNLSYAHIKANDPTVQDYLQAMPFKKDLENATPSSS